MEYWPSNPNTLAFVQTVMAIIMAALTIVSIAVSIIYVRANWRVMRIMETDLRFRTKPIPSLTVERKAIVAQGRGQGTFRFEVTVATVNAPLRFESLTLGFAHQDLNDPKRKHVHNEFLQVQNLILRTTQPYTYLGEFHPGAQVERWTAQLVYSDLAGVARYEAIFGETSQEVGYERVLPLRKHPRRRWFSRC